MFTEDDVQNIITDLDNQMKHGEVAKKNNASMAHVMAIQWSRDDIPNATIAQRLGNVTVLMDSHKIKRVMQGEKSWRD